jgi:hypothetical protein
MNFRICAGHKYKLKVMRPWNIVKHIIHNRFTKNLRIRRFSQEHNLRLFQKGDAACVIADFSAGDKMWTKMNSGFKLRNFSDRKSET